MEKRIVSYGESHDEFVEINGLMDEIRFKLCMKLYKTHDSIEKLENGLTSKSIDIIRHTN